MGQVEKGGAKAPPFFNPFSSDAMAEGYARSRPPVHPRVIDRILVSVGQPRFSYVLDVGCGSGVSTSAIADRADLCVGIDPAETMLRWARLTAAAAHFTAAAAEALPLRDRCVDLITAAGSLNYVDLDAFFSEADRVLRDSGVLAIYDFGPGQFNTDWLTEFNRRYPPPVNEGTRLDADVLSVRSPLFRVAAKDVFSISIPLTRAFYVDYMLTETNVASAVRTGVQLSEIRSWIESTLPPFESAEVVFEGYWVALVRQGSPVISRSGMLAS